MRIIFSIMILCLSMLLACEKEPHPEHITQLKTYLRYISPNFCNAPDFEEKMQLITSLHEAFDFLANHITTAVRHRQTTDNIAYGLSFVTKNEAPRKFIEMKFKGELDWKKEDIELGNIKIADIGCGLGLNALQMICELANFYKKNNWHFMNPILLDLYDVQNNHQNALQPIAWFVNTLFSEYFHVRSFVHDITSSSLTETDYDIECVFNLLHYIPKTRWGLAFANMEEGMKEGGLLFVTVDHYLAETHRSNHKEFLKRIAIEAKKKYPFLTPTLGFVHKDLTMEYAKRLEIHDQLIYKGYLRENQEYVPGKRYKATEAIDPDFLRKIFISNNGKNKKIRISIKGPEEKVCEEHWDIDSIMDNLNMFMIEAERYAFDQELLGNAIMISLQPETLLGNAVMISLQPETRLRYCEEADAWTSNLEENFQGFPTTVGITIIKE